MRRLAVLATCALLLVAGPVALPAGAEAAATHTTAATAVGDGTLLARGGFGARGFGRGLSSRRSTRSSRGYERPRRGRGRGFLRGLFHGLFWGWLLSHFFGGGFPLILPLLLIVFLLVAARRRRGPGPPQYRW